MEHQTTIGIHRYMVDHGVPKGIGEGDVQQVQFCQGSQAVTDCLGLDLPPFFLLLQSVVF
mgnify:CR=1 FL=1